MTTHSNLIVAIDSQLLVWGVRKQSPDPHQLKRARWLFEELDEEEAQIVVPSIALAEYLCPTDPKDHLGIVEAMRSRFIIAPFDVRCASLAAELFVSGKPLRDMGQPDARKTLKADSMIVATAKRSQASIFYTNDADCRVLASKVMEARDLPTMGKSLFA